MEIISSYSILPLMSGILVFVLGLFVWMKKPNELLHIIFFMLNFSISVWLFGTFFLFNAQGEIDQLFWDRFIYIGVIFIPIFSYHFGVIYCKVTNQNSLLYLGYISAFVFLPLSQLSDNFVSGLYHYSWGVHAIAQTYHHFFMVYIGIYLITFLVNLFRYYLSSTGMIKKQALFVLVGYAVFVTVGPMAFLPAYGVPIYPIVFLSGLAFSFLMGYAIIWLNTLDVQTITTEVTATLLNIFGAGGLFFSKSKIEVVMRLIISISIMIFSLFLVKSVKKEVKRREETADLADSLVKANARLQEFDKQKTDFLSIAAHQLRTPLSIANGYLELLNEDAYGQLTKDAKKIIHVMDESNGSLVKLVDTFLDITRLEQGRTKYDFKEANLNEIIEEVIKEYKNSAEQKGLKISWVKNIDLPRTLMDYEKVRHVVSNFIDNAIKYSEEGDVFVSAGEEMNGVAFKVRDGGIGFDQTDEANFFSKFYRGSNAKGINVNGTGLGLFVGRMFIEAHGGRVWAKSNGSGKGSEFGFWLPIRNTL